MIALPETITLPMKLDEQGVIRVSGTRVTLDTLIARYKQGETPEYIHQGFDVVPLADIYSVISYYLSHHEEVEAYLKEGEDEWERSRQFWEARYTPEQKARTEYFRQLLAEKQKEKQP